MTTFPKSEETKHKTTFPAQNQKKILVVDDDAMIRDLIYDALSVLDYEVATAGGGAEGFKQFSRNSFDLDITEGKMPGTNGWQLAALIKQVSAHTPIIMVTGQNKDEVLDKMQRGDVDFMLYKPIKLDSLYEAVRASWAMKSG